MVSFFIFKKKYIPYVYICMKEEKNEFIRKRLFVRFEWPGLHKNLRLMKFSPNLGEKYRGGL